MKSRSWWVVIVAIIAITAALAWFKVDQIQKAIALGESFGEPMEVVELAIVEQAQWQPLVSVTADVVAMQAINLTNELGGQVVEVGFAAGEKVRKGQLLLRLDTREEQAQLAAAQADAELARLELTRNQQLAKTGVASVEARDKSLAQRNAAVASEERLQAIIDKKTIRAPFDANAGIFTLSAGQYLQANTAITRLVGDTSQLWLDFDLPQHLATLAVGDSVTVSSPTSRSSISSSTSSQSIVPGESLQATVIARDSRVNPRSGNLRYRALTNNNGKLYPGTVVSVSVAAGPLRAVTRLPKTAVRYDATGPNVYVLVPAEAGAAAPERASKRPVTLGPEQNQQIVITSGVNIGERVAANGAFKLRDGLLVKAVQAASAVNHKPVTKSVIDQRG